MVCSLAMVLRLNKCLFTVKFWIILSVFCYFKSLKNFLKEVSFRLNLVLTSSAKVSVKLLNKCTAHVCENNCFCENK